MNKGTLVKVGIGHLIFILILLLTGWFPALFRPSTLKLDDDKIKFVKFAPATMPPPMPTPIDEPLVDLPAPAPITSTYVPPPPKPKPKPKPPPKIEPKPAPKPEPKPEPPPKIVKEEPKEEPEPEIVEIKEPEPEPEPEEVVVIEEPKPEPVRIEDIPLYKPPKPPKPYEPPKPPKPPKPDVVVEVRPPQPPPPPQYVSSASVNQMRAQLESHLGPIWSRIRPNRIRDRLTTVIRVRVDRSGRVQVLGLDRSSGNLAMDQAVQRCVRSLTASIAFPAGERGLNAEIPLEFTLN